ncbi:helix-turn-helix transcriptional regulator [Streptomyces albipurpureus]|uniref:AAA family ATPase n=1 Tax=Streptomyces albipurpureus TaxID=2897419 RepID=A0ABT0UKE1_9ACTN|nr:helix-turn-helix transcriptional regulator [Streptomyces sp. CWNU-1]MCM2387746.1 AAA family ATPase [Streptomyces sp. CWNU-1]
MSEHCAMLGDVENRSISPVFVGRAQELSALTDALVRAGGDPGSTSPGAPQALLVGGEAGVGKTRLLEELQTVACRRDAVVAMGGCVEIGADGLPFAPFSTALRALNRQLPQELASAAAGQEEELARLLPELAMRPSGEADRRDEEGMARLFELTARLLERMATDRTVVLVLEDLHWADTSTRNLLSYLFRTLRRGRLVVIATYRSDDVHRRHPLRPLLAELDRMRTVQRIELTRFNRGEVQRQLAGILAAEPEPEMVDQIFERSDGNAFFVEELACSITENCRSGLTSSLRDILLVRVEALPEEAQRAVRILAEGCSTVEHGLLSAVARLPEDDLIEALRAAVGANILLATSDGDGYRFRHSLVREAVSDDLAPGERSRINRRYAEVLEAEPLLVRDEERAMRLASYWYHAHVPAKALPAVLSASVEAWRRHAYAEQLRLLERAMELWDAVPESLPSTLRPLDYIRQWAPSISDPATTPLRFIDLMAEATVAGRLCGERERALKIAKRGQRLAQSDDDPLRASWFAVQRSRLVSALGRSDGLGELHEAKELVHGLPPSAAHAEVLAATANWARLRPSGPDALVDAERAVAYARMVGEEENELLARLALGGLLVDAGDHDEGFAEMHRVKERAVTLDLPSLIASAHINLPSALEGVGRSREAVDVLLEGLELCRHYRMLDTEAWVLGNLAESYYSLGRWDEIRPVAERALRIALSPKPRGYAATRLSDLALGQGDTDKAAEYLQAARSHFGTHDPLLHSSLRLDTIEIAIAAAQGRVLDARRQFRQAVEAGFPPGVQRYAWPLLRVVAELEADTRGLPAAEHGRSEALDLMSGVARSLTTGASVWRAYDSWVRVELLRAQGRDTAEAWIEPLAAFEQLDLPHERATVRLRRAEAFVSSDRPGATELLRQADETARTLGARPLSQQIALLAQRARISLTRPAKVSSAAPTSPAPGPAFGLTPREEDVLRLVAAGRSNRQIAAALYISPKTASVHVSNILAKLGVSGRVEAAALAHRLRLFPALPEEQPSP